MCNEYSTNKLDHILVFWAAAIFLVNIASSLLHETKHRVQHLMRCYWNSMEYIGLAYEVGCPVHYTVFAATEGYVIRKWHFFIKTKDQDIAFQISRQKTLNLQKYFNHFYQKPASVPCVPLWCLNFMQKIYRADSEICKVGRTDYWRTSNKRDY